MPRGSASCCRSCGQVCAPHSVDGTTLNGTGRSVGQPPESSRLTADCQSWVCLDWVFAFACPLVLRAARPDRGTLRILTCSKQADHFRSVLGRLSEPLSDQAGDE